MNSLHQAVGGASNSTIYEGLEAEDLLSYYQPPFQKWKAGLIL